MKMIREAARRQDKTVCVYEMTRHTCLCVDNVSTVIPRHREISPRTTQAICKQLEPELGNGWWRA